MPHNEKNSLFKFTLNIISERFNKNRSFSRDEIVQEAIQKYLAEYNEKMKAEAFINSFKSLMEGRQKSVLINTFDNFIRQEILNEGFLENYQNHYIHSIQVFLLGYNIITHWSYLTKKLKENNRIGLLNFRNFNFGWIIASLFHDEKYFVENQSYIIEKQRQMLSPFHILPDQIDISYDKLIDENLENYAKILYNDFINILNKGKKVIILEDHSRKMVRKKLTITYEHFKKLFDISADNVVDHGFLSAINYIKFLEKTQTEYRLNLIEELINKYGNTMDLLRRCIDENYLKYHFIDLRFDLKVIEEIINGINRVFLDWEVNKSAYLAIALHNFKQNKFEKFNFDYSINLSCRNIAEIIPYLLIICDTIQEWDRRLNLLIIEDNMDLKLKIIKKNERLEGNRISINKRLKEDINFSKNGANLKIDHVFENIIHKDSSDPNFKSKIIEAYKILLKENFKELSDKLPVCTLINENNTNLSIKKELDQNNIRIEELTNFILEPIIDQNSFKIRMNHVIEGIHYASIYFFL